MRYWLISFFLSLPCLAVPPSDVLLSCRSEGKVWKADFKVSSTEGAQGTFTKGTTTHRCKLKITFLSNAPRAHAPHLSFNFARKSCQPALSKKHEEEIFVQMFLNLSLLQPKKPVGWAQWLRKEQTGPCQVIDYDRESISFHAERWKNRTWGNK